MAKQVFDLGAGVTGKVLADLTITFCKAISSGNAVSQAGASLREEGDGVYCYDNPNVTEDTTVLLHLTVDTTKRAAFVLSPTDGDIARQTQLNEVKTQTDRLSFAGADVKATLDGEAVTLNGGSIADLAAAIWTAGTRTLTSIGSAVSDIANAIWGANVPDSDPPLTRGEAVDKLYIPGSTAPVVPTPYTPPDANLQVLIVNAKKFAEATWAEGDTVTMTLQNQDGGQAAGGSALQPTTKTTTINSDGNAFLTPDKGAAVTVKINKTGERVYFSKSFIVTDDDERDITAY